MKIIKFEIALRGGKKIYVNEEMKNKIKAFWESGEGAVVSIGDDTIDTKNITGIYGEELPDYKKQGENIENINRDFSNKLQELSRQSVEEKAKREMRARILPGWYLSGGKREDKVLRIAYEWIKEFFKQNPSWPYCPSQLWWEIIKHEIKQTVFTSKFFEYVIRHDNAVYDWMKLRKAK